jgi:hypothetical protein
LGERTHPIVSSVPLLSPTQSPLPSTTSTPSSTPPLSPLSTALKKASLPQLKKRKTTVVSLDGPEGLSLRHMEGKICIICNQKSGQTTLPYLKCGKHRTFAICKKQHLTSEPHLQAAELQLEEQLAIIRDSHDSNSSILDGHSDDEASEPDKHPCSGFLTSKPSKDDNCKFQSDGYLYIEEKNVRKYFCKPSHAFRYLIRYYGGRGQTDKSKSKSKKTAKQTNNKDEDEEEESEGTEEGEQQ